MKIAIIGAGIVGATASFYLRKHQKSDVTIFDYGKGQATKAAAGIICPWFSKRRNKAWYALASQGADFYLELIEDLECMGIACDFYARNGVLLLKKDPSKLDQLYQLAQNRKSQSPLIGELALLTKSEIQAFFPHLQGCEKAIYAEGGARVDGKKLCQQLIAASQYPVITKKVTIQRQGKQYLVDGQVYDKVLLATGAWLPEILEPLGYQVDIRPQKGQLIDFRLLSFESDHLPVVMPEGEIDIIPFTDGRVSIGASHENELGYDLTPDQTILEGLEKDGKAFLPILATSDEKDYRVGTRAYTSDFLPFYGQIPGMSNCYASSGLGSSGLTVGPLIARELVAMLLGDPLRLPFENYPIQNYIIYGNM
ncbi:NAD(P)/FAD-dependent oxidoreductase [Streptococcus uberis]|uniref:NAD(P)/FAD-dependent oxidoreductase n=1 Tax=Streptococcus uberis TaxID=1349 RepID=UPI0006203127|nr:FAD-dependent oxidoreductase [Streptococcus uberis]KKF60167.1 FAD dependent oxidoreductase [Streptococcus uberis B362]